MIFLGVIEYLLLLLLILIFLNFINFSLENLLFFALSIGLFFVEFIFILKQELLLIDNDGNKTDLLLFIFKLRIFPFLS